MHEKEASMYPSLEKIGIRDRVLRTIGSMGGLIMRVGRLIENLGDDVVFWAGRDEWEYVGECERRAMRRVYGKPSVCERN